MNTDLVEVLMDTLDSHFNFSNKMLSWESFNSEWQQAVEQNSSKMTGDEKDFLSNVHKEIEDILIHIPAKGLTTKDLDWKKWIEDDDFLRFMLSKESIRYSMRASDFKKILNDSVKSGYFKRPYTASLEFKERVCSFIESRL